MRIWILSSESLDYWAGGIAHYVDNAARLFAAEGHKVLVISRGEKDGRRVVEQGYEHLEFFHRFDGSRDVHEAEEPDEHPCWPYNNMAYFPALSYQFMEVVRELLKTESPPDIIECQEYAAIGYFLMQRKLVDPDFLRETPILMHLHTPEFAAQKINQHPHYKLPEYWIGRMEKCSMLMADALLSPSAFLGKEMQDAVEGGLPDIKTIPYPVKGLDIERDINPGHEGKLLYPGRIELRKGVEPLLIACEKLWQEGMDFSMELVGGDVHTSLKGGSLVQYFQNRYAHRINSGHLVFHGAVSHDTCMDMMDTASAVIIPSLWENFPNTCIEAMSLGKVVVVSDAGGQGEMIGFQNEAGYLFSHAEEGSLENTLRTVLALDPDSRVRTGARARERIRQMCSPEHVIPERIQHFQEVIRTFARKERFPFINDRMRNSELAPALSDDPLISVIVPFYNLGKFLGDCIDSIYTSEGVRFEILVVNDGSTDLDSLDVLNAFREKNLPNLRILDIANGGLANARNVGAREAKGELISFVDADDKVTPTFFKRCLLVLQRYRNVHMAYSWVRYFGVHKGIWHSWNFDLPYLMCHNQLIPIVLLRRETFLKHGKNKPHIVYGLEDYESWISLAEAGCGGVAIPETLSLYRVRWDSMFKVIDGNKKLYLYDLISHEHPDLYAEYGLELFNLQNANGPAYGWDQPTMFKAPQDRLLGWYEREKRQVEILGAENNQLKKDVAWLTRERERLLEKGSNL